MGDWGEGGRNRSCKEAMQLGAVSTLHPLIVFSPQAKMWDFNLQSNCKEQMRDSFGVCILEKVEEILFGEYDLMYALVCFLWFVALDSFTNIHAFSFATKCAMFISIPYRSLFQNARGKFLKKDSSERPIPGPASYDQCWWAVPFLQVLEASGHTKVSTAEHCSVVVVCE